MRRLPWIALVGLIGCGPEPAAIDTQRAAIIDGDLEEGYPAAGALVVWYPTQDEHTGSFCSASLIDERWVLTAAHCVHGGRGRLPDGVPEQEAFYIHFFIGTNADDPATGRAVPGKKIYVHPGYTALGVDNGPYDIALMELEEAVTDVTPFPIFRGDLTQERGADLFYVGFGQSDGDGGGSGRKRSATLRLNSVNPAIYVTAQAGGGVCFGDSGGPGLLNVVDHFEVVGVNSTVFGDPSCFEYSTQVRVDAYASWIDATMGNGIDCNVDETQCACPQACGADGVCDNARCGGESCENLYSCLRFCRTQLCQVNCLHNASPSTVYVFQEMVGCWQRECPNGDRDCIDTRCRREDLACELGLEATTGAGDCGTAYRCMAACDPTNLECQDACYFAADLEAQSQRRAVEVCIEAACAMDEDPALCAAEQCRAPLLTCMPDEACRLSGGSCAAGTACVVEPWIASYCVSTEGLQIGEACDPSAVACADGAMCLDAGDGPRCLELCSTGAECAVGFAPCTPMDVPGMPFSLGVCAETCPDADADGACDDADCHPTDPSIHPAAVEVCDADRIDEDCDGARNEGCFTCADGTLAMNCPAPAAPPPLPADEGGGCTCARPEAGAPSWLLLALPAIFWLRRRSLLALALTLAACGGDPEPMMGADAGVNPDANPPDVGFEGWDAGVWPDPSVFRIQQGLEAPGTLVRLEGLVVTSPVIEAGFFVAEDEVGPYRGIWVQLEGVDAAALSVAMGDQIWLEAEVAERAWSPDDAEDPTLTRTELVLRAASAIGVTGAGAPMDPMSVSRAALGIADLAEPFEGVLVRLDGLTVTDREDGRLVLDDTVRIAPMFLELDLSWLEPGTQFDTVRGPLHYEDGTYFVAPRTEEDLVRAPISFDGCIPDQGYTVCLEEIRWAEARAACGAQGGRLVVLETQEENLAVGGIMRRWFDGAFWIGLSDSDVEGEWTWVDGSTLAYDPWGNGEPNDWGGGEDCAHSNWRGDGVWNDARCRIREPYVCEFLGDGARCVDDDDCAAGPGRCVDGSCVPD